MAPTRGCWILTDNLIGLACSVTILRGTDVTPVDEAILARSFRALTGIRRCGGLLRKKDTSIAFQALELIFLL